MALPLPPTLDEILALSGNRPVFEDLVKLLGKEKERAVAFVGAGASAGLYPLWEGLISDLVDYAMKEGRAKPEDRESWLKGANASPQRVVRSIRRKLDDARYYAFIRQTFGPRQGEDGKRYTTTHAALLKLPLAGYVTTNYDPALDLEYIRN